MYAILFKHQQIQKVLFCSFFNITIPLFNEKKKKSLYLFFSNNVLFVYLLFYVPLKIKYFTLIFKLKKMSQSLTP